MTDPVKKKTVEVTECTCQRCGWVWLTKHSWLPAVCPHCKSRRWQIPKAAPKERTDEEG